MQYEEKSNLEERIIAHFDGSMDDASSKSLLDEVMASPEKRALFRAHETLDRVIAAARVPMEAPLETKRQIADRIPGLLAFIPGLLGTAETVPVLTQSANPFIAFFTRMSLSTAVSIGTAVAVLTTTGIIVKNNLDKAPASAKIAVVQNAPSTMNTNSTPQNYAMATPKAISSGISKHAAANVGMNPPVAQPVASEPVAPIADNISQPQVSQANVAASEDNAPLVTEAFDSPKPPQAIAADIPVLQPDILTPMPDEIGEGITVRPYVSEGSKEVQTSMLNPNGTATLKLQPSTENLTAGLDFEVGNRYAFRVQGGYSGFAEVIAVPTTLTPPPSLLGPPLKIYGPSMDIKTMPWTTFGASYTFLTPFMPVIVSGDIGAVWASNPEILTMAGFGTEIPIAGQLAVRPMITFDAVRISTQMNGSLPNNAIYEGPSASTTWSSAFGFQLNFVFRP